MNAVLRPAAVAMLLCLALVPSPDMPRAEEAADAFDCAACHPMRIRDFKGRRANPIVPIEEFPEEPTGKQDIASTSGMCLSCHDGFVADSREVWKDGYSGHRVGMVPGDGLHRKVACSTFTKLASVSADPSMAAASQMIQPPPDDAPAMMPW